MTTVTLRRKTAGFTFLEIMMVVVIIGILAAVVAPNLAKKTTKAKRGAAQMMISNFKTALSDYEMSMGQFPTTDQGLEALVRMPSGADKEEWSGPYLDDQVVPLDPWKHPYNYVCPATRGLYYDLWSDGPTDGADDDIVNWSVREEQ
jgi:general secretion pathway protein G